MKKTFDKLLRRNILNNFKQFLSIIIIVFLSMTLLSGFIVNSQTLENSINNYFNDTNLADAWIYTDKITKEDEQFFLDNEIDYEKRLEIDSLAYIKDSKIENNSKIFVYDTGKISTPYIYNDFRGCWIDKSVAQNKDLKIGQDSIVFNLNYTYQSGNVQQEINLELQFLITGTMNISECADTYSSWPILIDKNIFLEEVNRSFESQNLSVMTGITYDNISEIPYNQILIKTQNYHETIEKIENYYRTKENSNLFLILSRDDIESVVLLNSEIEQSKKMIYIFPIIFLIVSILVIITSINQFILQDRMKIGTLKSVGASNKMLLKHYSSYGAILCAIGAIAGVIIGPLLIPEIMFVKYDLVYSIPSDYVKISYPFGLLFIVFCLFIFIGYITSYLVCRNIIKQRPAESLKSNIKIKLKSRKKLKSSKLPISLKIALRNIKIKPIRTLMAIIGVAGCVALMLCGFGIGDTLKNSLDNDFNKLFSYDILSTYKTDNFLKQLESIDGIESYERFDKFYADCVNENNSKKCNVYSVAENSKFISENLKKGESFISKSIAEDLGIKEGDIVNIVINDKSQEIKITSIIDTSLLNGLYICGDYDFGDVNIIKGIWINANDDVNKIVERLNNINGTNDAKSMNEIIQQAENKISSISLMTTTLKVFALLLAVVVLLNFVFLILKERAREIATLKVLGENTFSIILAFFYEILFISIIGMVFGMLFGYPLLILVLFVNKIEIINFLTYISPLSFIFSAIIMLSILCLVTLFSMLKVKNINMIESLKSVE